MKYSLLLTTFLVSTLFCGVSTANVSIDFPLRTNLESFELALLPSIDEAVNYEPLPIKDIIERDAEGRIIHWGVIGENKDNDKDNDDDLTADSEPVGGYRSYNGDTSISSWDIEKFKEKQERFTQVLQKIKDVQSGKIPKPTKRNEYTGKDEEIDIMNERDDKTDLFPLQLALEVFAEPNIIEWLIQSGAELEKDGYNVALDDAIRAWKNVELVADKEKATQIYFKNFKLIWDKKAKVVGTLHSAIYVKQYDIINFLMDNGYVKPTQGDLCDAVAYLNWETIQKILNTGLDINGLSSDYKGHTPLMVAVEKDRLDIVEKLLEAGADPNQKSFLSRTSLSTLQTPLEAAIRIDSYDYRINVDLRVVRALLKAGAKPELPPKKWDNIRESWSKSDKILIKILIKYQAKSVFLSPTFWKMAKPEDVKAQIQIGEDVNEIGYKGWTPLIYANKYSPYPEEMVSLLKENGATGGTLPWDFNLELTPENIYKQIENGANPNTQKEEKNYGSVELKSPLVLAIEGDNVPAIKELLKNKVIFNGAEPLFYALGKDHAMWHNPERPIDIEVVKLLLEAGIDPNATEERTMPGRGGSDYVTSPLTIAIQKDELELVKLLLEYGADPNQWVDDKTALMVAVNPWQNNKHIEAIKLLLKFGADINKKDSKGRNVLFHVREKNDDDSSITELLLQNGADVNAKDRYGRSPFMDKARYTHDKNVKIVKKMIEMGADINAVDNDGKTVLDLVTEALETAPPAFQPPKKEIMDFLIAKGVKSSPKKYAWKYDSTETKKLEEFWHNISVNQIKEMIESKSILDSSRFVEETGTQQQKVLHARFGEGGPFVGLFCSAGENPTEQDIYNATLLNATRYQAPVEVIQYLLSLGADVNARDTDGRTPFIWASLDNADIRTLDLLVKSGARINARDNRGRTAIYYALGSNNKIEVIQKLIDLGIDLQNEDAGAITPRDYAGMVSDIDENGVNQSVKLIKKYNGLDNSHTSMHECQIHRNGVMDNCNGYII